MASNLALPLVSRAWSATPHPTSPDLTLLHVYSPHLNFYFPPGCTSLSFGHAFFHSPADELSPEPLHRCPSSAAVQDRRQLRLPRGPCRGPQPGMEATVAHRSYVSVIYSPLFVAMRILSHRRRPSVFSSKNAATRAAHKAYPAFLLACNNALTLLPGQLTNVMFFL